MLKKIYTSLKLYWLWAKGSIEISLIFGLLFLAFPLRLISPFGVEGGIQGGNYFRLPELALAGAFGLTYLFRQSKIPRAFLILLIFFLAHLSYWHYNYGPMIVGEIMNSLGLLIFIPAALCIKFRRHPKLSLNALHVSMTTLWLVQILHYISHISNKGSLVGISGNKNWFCAALVTSSLFPIFTLIKDFQKNRCSKRRLASLLQAFTIVLIDIKLITETSCRASMLYFAIALCLVTSIYLIQKEKKKALLGFLILITSSSIILGFSQSKELERIWAHDARPPLWAASAQLINANNLGVSPGKYINIFPYYDSVAHKSHIHHPNLTTHVHNFFLNLATEHGIVLSLLYAFLCAWALFYFFRLNKKKQVAFLATFLALCSCLIHGSLDKTADMPPNALMIPIFLGILLSLVPLKALSFKKFRKTTYALSLPFLFLTFISLKETSFSSYHLREALFNTETKDDLIKELTSAHNFAPHDLDIGLRLAYSYLRQGKYPEAIAEAKAIQSIAGNYGGVYYFLGEAHLALFQKNKSIPDLLIAARQFALAVAQNPNKELHRSELLRCFNLNPFTHDSELYHKLNQSIGKEITNALKLYRTPKGMGLDKEIKNLHDASQSLLQLAKWKSNTYLWLKKIKIDEERRAWAAHSNLSTWLAQGQKINSLLRFHTQSSPKFRAHPQHLSKQISYRHVDSRYWSSSKIIKEKFSSDKIIPKRWLSKLDPAAKKFLFPFNCLKANKLSYDSFSYLVSIKAYLNGRHPLIAKGTNGKTLGIIIFESLENTKFQYFDLEKKAFGELKNCASLDVPIPPQLCALRNIFLHEVLETESFDPKFFAKLPSIIWHEAEQIQATNPSLEKIPLGLFIPAFKKMDAIAQ